MGRAAVLRSTQAAALEVNSGSQVRSLFSGSRAQALWPFAAGRGSRPRGPGWAACPGPSAAAPEHGSPAPARSSGPPSGPRSSPRSARDTAARWPARSPGSRCRRGCSAPACAGAGCCPPGGSAPRRLFFLPLYVPCFPSVSPPSIAGFSIFLNGKPALWLCIYTGKRMVFSAVCAIIGKIPEYWDQKRRK